MLGERLREGRHNYKNLRHHYESIAGSVRWLDFQYRDPEPNFDRRKVHGVVAKLVRVKDQRFCAALDQVGGGQVNRKSNLVSSPFKGKCQLKSA